MERLRIMDSLSTEGVILRKQNETRSSKDAGAYV